MKWSIPEDLDYDKVIEIRFLKLLQKAPLKVRFNQILSEIIWDCTTELITKNSMLAYIL